MIVKPIKTRVFNEGENLLNFIGKYFKKIPEKSVLVVTSKIVALAENRTVIAVDRKAKESLIKQESQLVCRTKYSYITIKNGVVMASAGIDESNANGKYILLPQDSYKTARLIYKFIKQKYKIKDFGVLITDSRTMPLRSGTMGVAVGYAGFKGLKTYVGKTDIFGRKFKHSRVNVPDSLATAAVYVMGEGDERRPLAIITGAEIEFCAHCKINELSIDLKDDMYRPLFLKLARNKN